MLAELERVITKEKVSKTKDNLEVAIRALLDLKDPEEIITSKMVVEAVSIIERRTKRKGSGKLISFSYVSPLYQCIVLGIIWLGNEIIGVSIRKVKSIQTPNTFY